MKPPKNPMVYVVIPILLGVAFIGAWKSGLLGQDVVGYTTGYDGVKPAFEGVMYEGVAYEGGTWTRGTFLDFDPDDPRFDMCNLEGEMTSIFLPKDIGFGDLPSYIPPSRYSALDLMSTEPKVYEWQIDKTLYKMEEYDLKWFISLEAGYDSEGVATNAEGNGKRYHNTEVWIRLETNPNWIFEGADRNYFAVAKIMPDWVEIGGHDLEKIDVTPESQGSAVSLFYQPYGEAISLEEEDFTGFYSEGQKLNPALFRNQVYTLVKLHDFGTMGWFELPLNYKNQGDVVTWEFTVKIFVVGEWELQDVQEIPADYHRTSKVTTQGVKVGEWTGLGDVFDTLQGKLLALGVILTTIGVFLFLFWILAPVMVSSYMYGGGRNG